MKRNKELTRRARRKGKSHGVSSYATKRAAKVTAERKGDRQWTTSKLVARAT